jgi:uncharacterized protein YjbJ (UPF0337 family)
MPVRKRRQTGMEFAQGVADAARASPTTLRGLKGVEMRSKTRDKSGGTLDKLRGRVKEARGALSGNERSKTKGQARQAKGSARKKRGHLRDMVRK